MSASRSTSTVEAGGQASPLSIGPVAERTGATVGAIRHYESVGLLPEAARVGGKRRFDASIVGRVNLIRLAQDLGLSLTEIKAILDDQTGGWKQVVDDKLSDLTAKRDRLETMIRLLGEMRRCGCQAVTHCDSFPSG